MPAPLAPTETRPRTGFVLLVALIGLFAAAKAVVYDTLDPDCFWHLRVGEQLLRDGVRPLTDSLSFASVREPWVPYSWLAEIAMVKVWAVGGFRSAVAITALLQASLVGLLALSCREVTTARAAAKGEDPDRRWLAGVVGVAFGTFLSLPYLSFRPVTLAIVMLSAATWLLLRDRRIGEQSRGVWLVVPLTAVATNIHFFAFLIPAWVAGLLAGALWERWCRFDDTDLFECTRCVRRYAVLLAATLAAASATPLLPGVIQSVVRYSVADPMVRSTVIGEMQPFYSGAAGKLALVAVLSFFACAWAKQHRIRGGERVWLLMGTVLLLKFGRFSPLFALSAGPLFALTLPELSDRLLTRPALQFAVSLVLMLGVTRVATEFPAPGAALAAWVNRNGPETPGYPTASAEFVAGHVRPGTGRLVNEFGWGGYLEWRLGNQFQVLVDGRTQLFTPQFWSAAYLDGDGPRRNLLQTLRADAAVVPRQGSLFRPTLVALGWRAIHQDDRAEVLVPPTSPLAGVDPAAE